MILNRNAFVIPILPAVSLLLLCCSAPEPSGEQAQEPESAGGFVLQPDEGEMLILRRPGGSQVSIKVDPLNTGSRRVAMGTQKLQAGYGIPLHRHEHQDEIVFVHRGNGTAVVGDETVSVEPGTTVYIPQGVWHGVDNTGEEQAEIIWVIAPPGLEEFFRDIGTPPGTDAPVLTPEEMAEINRKHGITIRAQR